MKISTILCALLVVAIWGFNPSVSKLGMLEVPAFAFLSIRYLLTALIFLPFAKVRRNELKMLFLVAFLANVFSNGLLYIAYQYLQPAAATLLSQTETPITILMACLFAKEKIGPMQVLSVAMAFCGIVVILGIPEISLFGAALILLTRISWGACQLMFKNTQTLQPAAFIAYTSLFALPFVGVISLIIEPNAGTMLKQSLGLGFVLVMAFQIFPLSLANVLWQKLIALNGVNKISPFVLLEIVFSVIAGFLLFGDGISLRIMLGIVLITSGVWFATQEVRCVQRGNKRCKIVSRRYLRKKFRIYEMAA